MAPTDEMRASFRTLHAFFDGDPDVGAGELRHMLEPIGEFHALMIPHHGSSEPSTGVVLRCGFAIATNGDVLHPAHGALIRADQLADALASFASRNELADLPMTDER